MAFETALTTIAGMIGANRIVREVSAKHPTGEPSLSVGHELKLRIQIVELSLRLLEAVALPTSAWEVKA